MVELGRVVLLDELRVDRLPVLLRFMLPVPVGELVSVWSIVVRSVDRVLLPFCMVPFCIVRSDWVADELLRVDPLCEVPIVPWVLPVLVLCPCG